MKATRVLLVVCLGLAVAAGAGCSEKYTIKITNVSSEIQSIQVLDDMNYPCVDGLAVAPDGGKASCSIKQDENASVAYTLKANKYATQFTVNKGSPNPMYFRISPEGIVGPTSADARVSQKWEEKKEIRIDREKVE
jgi:hypothetical protein